MGESHLAGVGRHHLACRETSPCAIRRWLRRQHSLPPLDATTESSRCPRHLHVPALASLSSRRHARHRPSHRRLHRRPRRDAPPSRLRLLHLSPHAGQTLLSHSGGYSHGTVYRRTQVSSLACRLLYPRGGREVPSPPSFSHARAGETYKSDPRSMGGLGFRCPYDVEAYGCDSLQYRTHRHRGHWRGPSRWGNEYSVLGHPPRLLRLLLRH